MPRLLNSNAMKPRTTPAWRAALLAALISTSACGPEPALEPVPFPGGPGSGQPRLTADADGGAVLSWLEPVGEETALRYVPVTADGFGAPREVVRRERMFINWADFPAVTPIGGNRWFAHWLEIQPDSFGAYDVKTAVSGDGGLTWSMAEQMNEDETETEHGFVSVFPWDGRIAAFWLDGRELANWSFDDPEALLGVSLRLATYDAGGRVGGREVVDELVCDCCQPDVAITDQGPIVIYRDRSENEIRDVVVRRFRDGAWSAPVNLGNEAWFIEGCPVNGPVIAARGPDVAAAWFTAPDGRGRVRFARSADAGASFSAAVDVDANGAYGQPAIVLDEDGRAVIGWWRRAEGGGIDLVAQAYAADGSAGPIAIIAHESVAQPVSVPQLIRVGDRYLTAFSTFDAGGTVRLAAFRL